MARLPRICYQGITQHIIQRGNNRHVCFGCNEDFVAYANWLRDYSVKYKVAVHAWVLASLGSEQKLLNSLRMVISRLN